MGIYLTIYCFYPKRVDSLVDFVYGWYASLRSTLTILYDVKANDVFSDTLTNIL